jgi:hypothetical protein
MNGQEIGGTVKEKWPNAIKKIAFKPICWKNGHLFVLAVAEQLYVV